MLENNFAAKLFDIMSSLKENVYIFTAYCWGK